MVSTGDAPIGIQKMTREILGVVKDLPEAMHDLTGVDITKVTRSSCFSKSLFKRSQHHATLLAQKVVVGQKI